MPALVLSAASVLSACGSKQDAPKPVVRHTAVSVSQATPHLFHERQSVQGDIVSYDSPNIGAETQGKVMSVLVKPGDRVRAGQLLARLDDTDTRLAVAQAQGTVAHNAAQLAEKQRMLARNRALAAEDLIAQQTLTSSEADEKAAEGDLLSAQAVLTQASVNQQRTGIVAPFPGTVTSRAAQPGMYVTAGTTLFTVASDRPATLEFKAPEQLLAKVRKGQGVLVDIDGSSVKTTVSAVRPVVDPVSRNFVFSANAPQLDATWTPGRSLTGHVELSEQASPALPEKAVVPIADSTYVYVVEGGKAHRLEVRTGSHEDGLVEILSGLPAGAQAIADGATFVVEGQPVDVQAAKGGSK